MYIKTFVPHCPEALRYGEECCKQSYPCKEAVSGFELMINKSPRHNFTAAPIFILLTYYNYSI